MSQEWEILVKNSDIYYSTINRPLFMKAIRIEFIKRIKHIFNTTPSWKESVENAIYFVKKHACTQHLEAANYVHAVIKNEETLENVEAEYSFLDMCDDDTIFLNESIYDEIMDLINENRVITAIKYYKEIVNVELKKAKHVVDSIIDGTIKRPSNIKFNIPDELWEI